MSNFEIEKLAFRTAMADEEKFCRKCHQKDIELLKIQLQMKEMESNRDVLKMRVEQLVQTMKIYQLIMEAKQEVLEEKANNKDGNGNDDEKPAHVLIIK